MDLRWSYPVGMTRKLNNWSYQDVANFLRENGFSFFEELNDRQVWVKLQEGLHKVLRKGNICCAVTCLKSPRVGIDNPTMQSTSSFCRARQQLQRTGSGLRC